MEKKVEEKVEEKSKGDKKLFVHESGQLGYMDENNNFVPAN
jgi:TRAP-type C4-dicarboxylate transport system substrate-binding protein